MKDRPQGLADEQVCAELAGTWRLSPASLVYSPVGAGSYHWTVTDADGSRLFVTVDDLDGKPWLGSDRDSVFASLRRCYETARTLRDEAGLEFIVAPLAQVARLTGRYAVAVLPHVEGRPLGDFDTPPEACAEIVALMARLHEASSLVEGQAPARSLEIPDRAELEEALAELGQRWGGGPLGEDARRWLRENALAVQRELSAYDALAADVATTATQVITHGEPHAGNFLRSAGKLRLVDWDTVAFAPPERDLWLCCRGGDEPSLLYEQLTGREVNPAAIRLFTVGWRLSDIASYLAQLRRPHADSEDARRALRVLRQLSRPG